MAKIAEGVLIVYRVPHENTRAIIRGKSIPRLLEPWNGKRVALVLFEVPRRRQRKGGR